MGDEPCDPGKIILGEPGDIESGVRQLIRNRPLEVTEVELPSGQMLRVPTPEETLRIKGYLIVRRNQVRDDEKRLAWRSAAACAAWPVAMIRDVSPASTVRACRSTFAGRKLS
jgi:hypothetical protein